MSKTIFLIAFIFAGFIFLTHFWLVGNGVWGDGRYYYAYVRSLLVDKNLDFENEMAHFGEPILVTQKGRVANKFSIGPALFWLPIFALVHLIARGDGYSPVYQVATGLGSVFYGILGLYLGFGAVRKYFSEKTALIASLGIWLGSNLFFYTAVDPINSHAISFLVAAAVVYFWDLDKKWGLAKLGVLVGILAMIRTQDLVFAVPIIMAIIWRHKTNFKEAWLRVIIFIASTIIGFLPQLAVWKLLYGGFKSPYFLAGETFFWLKPKILAVLLSSQNGLFYYSPILIFSLVGVWFFKKRGFLLAFAGILLFLLQTYLIASWHIWWGGAAYGARMFISLLPFFIIGLAAILEKNPKRERMNILLIIIFIMINFYSMIDFLLINP